MKSGELLFVIVHPLQAAVTKVRQIEISIKHATPPAGSTIEAFPLLPLNEAAGLIFQQTEASQNGVPLNAWPKIDQERMRRGELPQSHPEHPNV